ncbi:STP1 protein [Plasmodium ovale curtisi]|uniref:STP1 protein n=1 Tax=Plasmodium ovale curtisi TaxID=864141 RepID=A0A1A8X6L8_PLAOA|nr:STP1 protein [Plasmodium ovale curtisi]
MGDYSGYTTNTRDVDIVVFLHMIKGDIKKLIHKYGHKKCGLRHEELCEEIKKVILEKKEIVFEIMDTPGRKKWRNDWDSKREGFFNNLFEGEGFINMCYPKNYKNNPSLYQLKSKHIQFCKERDVRKAAVEKNNKYNECVRYNKWVIAETTSLTREFLNNVRVSSLPTVKKYFITKAHPRGYDPRDTYPKSKLDCTIYNPPPRSHPQMPLAKTPTNSLNPPTAHDVRHESQRKGGSSLPGRDGRIEITKNHVKKLPQAEHSASDSQTYSLTNTKVDGTPNIQHTDLKPKDTGTSVNKDDKKKESTPIQGQAPANSPSTAQAVVPPPHPKDAALTPITQSVPEPATTTSLIPTLVTVKDLISSQTPVTSPSLTITSYSSANSGSPLLSDPLPPIVVTKDQDKQPQSTTTPVTSANIHSTETLPAPSVAVPSLDQSQPPPKSTPPAITALQESGIPASSSASTFTNTVTSTSTAPPAVTISTMSTTAKPISSVKEDTSAPSSQESPPTSAAVGPEATASATARDPQQTVIPAPTSLSGSDTAKFSVQMNPDGDPGTKSAAVVLPNPKGPIKAADNQLSNDTQQTPGNPSKTRVTIPHSKVQRTPYQIDQQNNTRAPQHPPNIGVVPSTPDKSGASVNTPIVNTKTPSMDDSTVRTNKNDNPSITPEGIPPLTHIIPTLLIILGTLTLLFQLYKYTPLGFLLGRRRKRKKRDLRRIFEIPEKPAYESPNITVHEWEDHNLVGQTKENDVFIKLLKINKYKQEMQKRKKKNKKTLIEVHMEVLEESKNNEWELHKGDFLEICLHGFINEESDTYSKLSDSELTVNNTNKDETVENIQKQEILWNNWIENQRNILEQWKEKEWFHILKNKWRNEQQKYKEKNDKLQENILNEQETYSIVSQKEIWKQWISKQANLIDLFNKEDWFKSMVYVQDKEKDNYHVNEYKNTSITSQTELKNEKTNYEHCRGKNIIQKLMVQIHMMVLEECIKKDIIKHKELCIDNFIEDIHNQNNYDEKRNILQCDTDDFDVLEFQEIQTSRNK